MDDGTHRTYYYSFDGYNFWQMYQVSDTSFLTPSDAALVLANGTSA